jgi:hypothetical protein
MDLGSIKLSQYFLIAYGLIFLDFAVPGILKNLFKNCFNVKAASAVIKEFKKSVS